MNNFFSYFRSVFYCLQKFNQLCKNEKALFQNERFLGKNPMKSMKTTMGLRL